MGETCLAESFLRKLEAIQPFTEREAWALFRIAAFGEAIGWALLISGILVNRYRLPGHVFALPIAGQIHGTLFLIYFGLLIAVYSSLRWPRKRFFIAALMGVIPFGTLIFEQWVARTYRNRLRQSLFCNAVIAIIDNKPGLT